MSMFRASGRGGGFSGEIFHSQVKMSNHLLLPLRVHGKNLCNQSTKLVKCSDMARESSAESDLTSVTVYKNG